MEEGSRAIDGKDVPQSGDSEASAVPILEAQAQEQDSNHRTLGRRDGASGGRDGALSNL